MLWTENYRDVLYIFQFFLHRYVVLFLKNQILDFLYISISIGDFSVNMHKTEKNTKILPGRVSTTSALGRRRGSTAAVPQPPTLRDQTPSSVFSTIGRARAAQEAWFEQVIKVCWQPVRQGRQVRLALSSSMILKHK